MSPPFGLEVSDRREQFQQDLSSAYTFEQELTGGFMSRLFVATDNSLGRRVVIKILPSEMGAAVISQRFRLEIQVSGKSSARAHHTASFPGRNKRALILLEGDPLNALVPKSKDFSDLIRS
jgi:hypothetical protein